MYKIVFSTFFLLYSIIRNGGDKMENLKGELIRLDLSGIKPNYSKLSRIYGKDRRTIKKEHEIINKGLDRQYPKIKVTIWQN